MRPFKWQFCNCLIIYRLEWPFARNAKQINAGIGSERGKGQRRIARTKYLHVHLPIGRPFGRGNINSSEGDSQPERVGNRIGCQRVSAQRRKYTQNIEDREDWAQIDIKNKFQIGNVIDRQTAEAEATKAIDCQTKKKKMGQRIGGCQPLATKWVSEWGQQLKRKRGSKSDSIAKGVAKWVCLVQSTLLLQG